MYKNKSLSLNACELLEILKQRIRLSLKQNAKSQLRQISKILQMFVITLTYL